MTRSQIQERLVSTHGGYNAVLPLLALMALVSPLGPKFINFKLEEGLWALQIRLSL